MPTREHGIFTRFLSAVYGIINQEVPDSFRGDFRTPAPIREGVFHGGNLPHHKTPSRSLSLLEGVFRLQDGGLWKPPSRTVRNVGDFATGTLSP